MIQAMKDLAGGVERFVGEPSASTSETAEGLCERTGDTVYDRNAIARLSCEDIERMSCAELIRAIRESRAVVLRPKASQRFEYFERRTLQQLVHILRRSFQEQKLSVSGLTVGGETADAVSRGSANTTIGCCWPLEEELA